MAYSVGCADILSLLGVTAADFHIQKISRKNGGQSVVVQNRVGLFDPGTIVVLDEKTDYSIVLKAKAIAGAAATFNLGGIGTAGMVITGAQAQQDAMDYATLTVNAHLHDTTTTHESSPAALAVTTPLLGLGVLDVPCISGALPDDLQKSSWSVESQHKDRVTRVGVHSTGYSTAYKFSNSFTMLDTGTKPTIDSDWTQEEDGDDQSNTDMKELTMSAVMYPAL
jgi:hypothetical protein